MALLLLCTMVLLLAYIYFGYPLLMLTLAAVRPRPIRKHPFAPTVSVIVTAYNERPSIERKIRNVLQSDYRANLVEVIVASDASDDGTDDVVIAMAHPLIKLLRVEGRKGKTACQNAAAAAASGDILVFTDATTDLDPGALRALAGSFSDSSVGCVAGRLVYTPMGGDVTARGGTSYWNYESILRAAESAVGSLIGVSGCLYAVRRHAYRAIDPGLISDFVIAMVVREQGLRTVLEPTALCYEATLERPDQELAMRVRVGLRSLCALSMQRRFLNPLRFGMFAWQLWSHKLLRYLSPVFWGMALLANLALAAEGRYVWLLSLQLAVLAAGLLGFVSVRVFAKSGVLAQPYYFLLTNLASAVSLFRFLRGERIVTWTPVR